LRRYQLVPVSFPKKKKKKKKKGAVVMRPKKGQWRLLLTPLPALLQWKQRRKPYRRGWV
jgi:hypothetical protein